jgi:hypothetical protein
MSCSSLRVGRRCFVGALLLCVFSSAGIAAGKEVFPGMGRKWRCYQSPNFEMYSANNDGESRAVLEHLELLRAVFLESFKLSVRAPQPVTVFYFNSDRDFHGYWPPEYSDKQDYVGFCFNQMDRTVISLAPARDDASLQETVYHEFIHYLVRIAEMNPPAWFNEGVAELYSTIQAESGDVELGLPIAGRIIELRRGQLIPLDQLFATGYNSDVFRESRRTDLFYAESWAFLHYCRFGISKLPKDKLDVFLRLASRAELQDRPEILRNACRELLGFDYSQLEEQLQRYVNTGRYQWGRIPRPAIADKKTYAQRPVSPDETADRLAELSLRITHSPLAKLHLLNALDREPDNPRLYEVLGAEAIAGGEEDSARERWRKAVEAGTVNTAICRELVRIEANRRFSTFDYYYRLPDEEAGYMRALLQRSIAAAPEQSEGYEMMAWVEATAGTPDIANVNLVQGRFNSLNDKPRTLLALILARLRFNDRQAALHLLDQLDKMSPNQWVVASAEIVRAMLENRAPRRIAVPEQRPAIRLQPDFRLNAGK